MSLDVSPALLEQAERGEVDEAEFVDCVRTSLPYAWEMISSLVAQLKVDGGPFADNQVPPPSEQERGQLLRALASDAIRGALQRHFGVRLAFQNCHRVAVFPLDATESDPGTAATYGKFTSIRSQILNQSPELRDC
ncbi:SCO5389 family protein [Actinacidiphila alni]|uniref:SCO5389 family protein n=1 Tax=Actinacidiphila alni TaxID=380248 RepID=UPI0033FFCBDD